MEHRAYWAIKTLNFDLAQAGKQRLLQMNELDELRVNHMRAPEFTKRGSSFSMTRPLLGRPLNLTKRYCCTAFVCTCFQENSVLGGLAHSLSR